MSQLEFILYSLLEISINFNIPTEKPLGQWDRGVSVRSRSETLLEQKL